LETAAVAVDEQMLVFAIVAAAVKVVDVAAAERMAAADEAEIAPWTSAATTGTIAVGLGS
jgi:hypothetical protein